MKKRQKDNLKSFKKFKRKELIRYSFDVEKYFEIISSAIFDITEWLGGKFKKLKNNSQLLLASVFKNISAYRRNIFLYVPEKKKSLQGLESGAKWIANSSFRLTEEIGSRLGRKIFSFAGKIKKAEEKIGDGTVMLVGKIRKAEEAIGAFAESAMGGFEKLFVKTGMGIGKAVNKIFQAAEKIYSKKNNLKLMLENGVRNIGSSAEKIIRQANGKKEAAVKKSLSIFDWAAGAGKIIKIFSKNIFLDLIKISKSLACHARLFFMQMKRNERIVRDRIITGIRIFLLRRKIDRFGRDWRTEAVEVATIASVFVRRSYRIIHKRIKKYAKVFTGRSRVVFSSMPGKIDKASEKAAESISDYSLEVAETIGHLLYLEGRLIVRTIHFGLDTGQKLFQP